MHAYREGHASAGAATACRQELTEAHRNSSSSNPVFNSFRNQQGRRFSQSGSPAFVLFATQQQFGIKSFTVIEKSTFRTINPRNSRTVNDFIMTKLICVLAAGRQANALKHAPANILTQGPVPYRKYRVKHDVSIGYLRLFRYSYPDLLSLKEGLNYVAHRSKVRRNLGGIA